MPGAETFRGSVDAYDRHVGRYGSQLASALIEFTGLEQGMRTLDVGCGPGALTEVRESHGTFEDYCRERWGFSRQRAHQLVEAASVSRILDTPPLNAGQAVELAPLRDEPEQLAEAWQASEPWFRSETSARARELASCSHSVPIVARFGGTTRPLRTRKVGLSRYLVSAPERIRTSDLRFRSSILGFRDVPGTRGKSMG